MDVLTTGTKVGTLYPQGLPTSTVGMIIREQVFLQVKGSTGELSITPSDRRIPSSTFHSLCFQSETRKSKLDLGLSRHTSRSFLIFLL